MGIVKNIVIALLVLIPGLSAAQTIEIALGPEEIGSNQIFTITVSVKEGRLKSYEGFPDIEGFAKRGTSSSSSTNIVNGQISTTQSITMNYVPLQQGTFEIKPFTMTINGEKVNSNGQSVKVGPPVERRRSTDPFFRDPFEDLFGKNEETSEFVDVKEDAFLALSTDKDNVFIGEGVTATLAFYVSENNRAPLQFYDLGRQVSDIVKDLKPSNTWEENFNIENISGRPVTINGKSYTQYKIYQATYFPFNLEPLNFPSVPLEMIKYKVAKNPTFFGQNRKEDFKTFYSKPKSVKVVSLPEHPLKDLVSVGDFRLAEKIDKTELETGQSFDYQFRIYGEGNIASLTMPEIRKDKLFDFYDPTIQQNIERKGSKVSGSKSFNYFGIPHEPGEYNLADYFNWIYFNTRTERYDTLRSTLSIFVTGESQQDKFIQSNDLGPFYDIIDVEENELKPKNRFSRFKVFANAFILVVLTAAGVIVFKK